MRKRKPWRDRPERKRKQRPWAWLQHMSSGDAQRWQRRLGRWAEWQAMAVLDNQSSDNTH